MKKRKAPGKWIRDLGPDMPVLEAARAVLDIRLEAVEMMLPLAAEKARDDIEHVHQLRVATRRADAALRLFEPCIKPSRLEKARKRLRRIRRAAGDARICDVHGAVFKKLGEQVEESHRPFMDELIEWNRSERSRAQKSIRKVAARHSSDDLARSRTKLIKSLRLRGPLAPADDATRNGQRRKPTLLDLASMTLPGMVAAVREAGRADLTLLKQLHQLRIAGKRLRYGLEVFASCFGEDGKSHYKLVESLQNELGEINDAHEMLLRLTSFIEPREAPGHIDRGHDAWRDSAAEILKLFHQRRDDGVDRFLEQWRAGRWQALLELTPLDANLPTDAGSADASMTGRQTDEVQA